MDVGPLAQMHLRKAFIRHSSQAQGYGGPRHIYTFMQR